MSGKRRAQALRALLAGRQQLVEAATAIRNAIRGLLKPFGLIPGKGAGNVFCQVREKLAGEDALGSMVGPVLMDFARGNQARRPLMMMPGIGASP